MAQVVSFKEIFDQVLKDLDQNCFIGTKRQQRPHYIYYLARYYSHHVRNDTTVLIKDLKRL